jgi:hypothetical protein
MLANARSGYVVLKAHMSTPTPQQYVIWFALANLFCTFGSGLPTAALNHLYHVGSVGRQVEHLLVLVNVEKTPFTRS